MDVVLGDDVDILTLAGTTSNNGTGEPSREEFRQAAISGFCKSRRRRSMAAIDSQPRRPPQPLTHLRLHLLVSYEVRRKIQRLHPHHVTTANNSLNPDQLIEAQAVHNNDTDNVEFTNLEDYCSEIL